MTLLSVPSSTPLAEMLPPISGLESGLAGRSCVTGNAIRGDGIS